MPNHFSALLIASFIFALLNIGYADLPIHCLQHQVSGQWKLQISEPQSVANLHDMNCGHQSPDDPANSYLALKNTFKPAKEFIVALMSDATVKSNSQTSGSWTMVYDEAVDITHDNQRFTAFFEYYPDESGKVMSYCGRTVVGWYQNLISGTRACFKGEKQLHDQQDEKGLYGEPVVQMHVVQPDQATDFLQLGFSSKSFKNSRKMTTPNLHKGYNDHQYVANKLNEIPSKLWKARTYSDFENKSLGDLNNLAGRKKHGGVGQRPSLQNSFIQTSDVADLPKEFSWKDHISPPRSQNSCGSCYVFATLGMIEARLRIKYDKDVHLSVQHVLDCSFYNQGCRGGYPFLVEKFTTDFELVPESCSPYLAETGSCGTCNTKTLNEVYKTKSYKFIGGAYGKSNEREMMVELMNNGPIVVSFEPASDFMYYETGVYHSVEPEWLQMGESKPEWERVDHSVLLYGWGETETGDKYWTIMNSWGPNWGEGGSFRMKRGVDESAIESMAEAADPIIISQSNSA